MEMSCIEFLLGLRLLGDGGSCWRNKEGRFQVIWDGNFTRLLYYMSELTSK